ncbi:AAA family ATPase [Amycolatopsis sp. NPDC049691]|uniref:ATP-binding protein n=1 Tax=Amycolatopsis sp. NPDC049691 TaxID=3155155 RepID=UPI003440031E
MTGPLPFVGREAVLAEAGAVVAGARAGRGGLVLLTGAGGAGKTRLAAEIAAAAAGFRTVWAWCPPGGDAAALGPWAQVLRDLVGADVRGGRVARGSPELRAVVTGRAADDSATDPEEARRRLGRDVAAVLRAGAAETPLLVVLDDVHEADASSLRLLAETAATVRTARVAVVATARDDDRAWRGRVQARADLLGRALCLPIGPLREDDVAELVTAATGRPATPAEVGSIVARTRGEAFFVTELVRHGIGTTVPASVRAVVQARIAALPTGHADTLDAAAVLGVRFRLDLLAEVVGRGLADIRAILGDSAAAGLLGELDAGSATFRHQLLRDAVYDAVPPAERAGLHARAAAVLARYAERGRDAGPAQVAYHFLRAGPEHARAAARYARLAGDHAAELLAHDEAVAWYERCRELLGAARPATTDEPAPAGGDQPGAEGDLASGTARLGGGTTDEDLASPLTSSTTRLAAGTADEDLAGLLIASGTARLGAGDRTGARTDFLAAATHAASRPELLARAALGLGAGASGIEVGLLDRDQIALLERARAALPAGDSALRAAVTARLSVATTLLEPDQRRLALAEEALAIARRVGDPAATAQALAALCDAKPGPGHCTDRLAWAGEVVELARGLRDPKLELLGRRLRLVALLETGAVAEADAEALAFEGVAAGLDQPFYLWYGPLWRGMRALLEGRYDDCRATLARTEELAEVSGSANALVLAATQRWCLLAATGDRDGLTRLFAEVSLEELPGVWPRVTLALAAAQFGRLDEARDRLSAVAPRLATAPRDSEWLPMLAQAAETVALTGPHPVARAVYDWLLPHAGRFVVEGIGAAVRGPVHRHLALLAQALGEPSGTHRAHALAAAKAIGATALAATIEAESGTATVPAGDTFTRDGDLWVLRFAGREVRLADAKGLHDLACLLARPGVAVPAVELAAPGAPPQGDLGDVVDASARAAYRTRLRELEAAADAADEAGDAARSAEIAAERAALLDQLSTAYGLGGRPRRTGSSAERARTAVTARVRATIDRIGRVHPELGRHLRAAVRTGSLCAYEPETPHTWRT